jgi:pimeloyl-ACP methyl ester carboxylesterase
VASGAAPLHLASEVSGRAGAPALALVHGILSSNLQWEPNRAALGERLRLVAVELWGHGASPAPHEPAAYCVARYLKELERIREQLGIARWFVCGQSFGAGIAIRYALAHAERTLGLVVTNSRSAFSDAAAEARDVDLATWQAIDRHALPFHPVHASRFPADLRARMVAAADAVPAPALWQAIATTARELSCRDVAGQIRVPTLLVNGRFEKRFQPDRDFAASAIPGVSIADLDGGHAVNVDAASAFDAAVLAFTQRVLASGR